MVVVVVGVVGGGIMVVVVVVVVVVGGGGGEEVNMVLRMACRGASSVPNHRTAIASQVSGAVHTCTRVHHWSC